MSRIEELADRVERLLLRHGELQRMNGLLQEQLTATNQERDNLRSRLNAARNRIDVLLQRLPQEPTDDTAVNDSRTERAMKQIEATIMGQSYVLGCPEGGEMALLEAVGQVDREMSAIRDGGKVKARERIAVLAALNLAYALTQRPASESPASAAHAGSIDIDALVKRIDTALHADGQLL